MESVNTLGEQSQDLQLFVQNLSDGQKDELLEILKKDKNERLDREKGKSLEIESKGEEPYKKMEISQDVTSSGEKWDEGHNKDTEIFKEDVPQELKDFREKWENKNKLTSSRLLKAFREIAKTTPINVKTDVDGSRIIEFKLGGKIYTILQPNLEKHTDAQYKRSFTQKDADFLYGHPMNPNPYVDEIKFPTRVYAGSMSSYIVKYRKNEKLKQYVLQKKKEGLHLPKVEDMRRLLFELWDTAGENDYMHLRDFDKESIIDLCFLGVLSLNEVFQHVLMIH